MGVVLVEKTGIMLELLEEEERIELAIYIRKIIILMIKIDISLKIKKYYKFNYNKYNLGLL